jgi:hypothetical protein
MICQFNDHECHCQRTSKDCDLYVTAKKPTLPDIIDMTFGDEDPDATHMITVPTTNRIVTKKSR